MDSNSPELFGECWLPLDAVRGGGGPGGLGPLRGLPGGNVSVIDIKLAIGLWANCVTEEAVVDNCGIDGGAIDCGGRGCGWDVGNAGGVELPSETAGWGNVGKTIKLRCRGINPTAKKGKNQRLTQLQHKKKQWIWERTCVLIKLNILKSATYIFPTSV